MTRVINIRAPGRGTFVKVCRPTIFGNPIVLGKRCPECGVVHVRDPQMKALVCYGQYLIRRLDDDWEFRAAVRGLIGEKRIGCWCAPAPCHGDLLAVYLAHAGTSHANGWMALTAQVAFMADNATRQQELF